MSPRDAGTRTGTPAAVLWLVLGLVGLGWGSSQLIGKIAVSTGHPALGIAFWQTLIGAALLLGYARMRGSRLPLTRRHLLFYAVCGFLGTALPHTLSYVAVRHLPVGVHAMVVSLVPMTTFLIAAVVGAERAVARRLFGLSLGAVALALLIGPEASLPDPAQAVWVLVSATVALSYALENVFIAEARPEGCGPLTTLTGLTCAAVCMIAPAVLVTGSFVPLMPFGQTEAAMVALAPLQLGPYLGLIWLIGRAGPVFASQVSYLVTGTAVALGILVLGERHSGWVWAALGLIFVGLTLVRPRRG